MTASDNFSESEFYKVIFTDHSYLNNTSSDTVFLDCPEFDAGPVTYPDNVGTKSYARVPNGSDSFIVLLEITQGSANPDPTPTPTPSPTTSPTATYTSIQSPTPTPTPTTLPTPTKSPTLTKTPTPKPTKSPTPTPDVLGSETIAPENSGSNSDQEVETPDPENTNNTSKPPVLAIVFIGLGTVLIGTASYSIWVKSKIPPPQNII